VWKKKKTPAEKGSPRFESRRFRRRGCPGVGKRAPKGGNYVLFSVRKGGLRCRKGGGRTDHKKSVGRTRHSLEWGKNPIEGELLTAALDVQKRSNGLHQSLRKGKPMMGEKSESLFRKRLQPPHKKIPILGEKKVRITQGGKKRKRLPPCARTMRDRLGGGGGGRMNPKKKNGPRKRPIRGVITLPCDTSVRSKKKKKKKKKKAIQKRGKAGQYGGGRMGVRSFPYCGRGRKP